MSLSNYCKGYAVMSEDLSSYRIESEYLHVCKEWCPEGWVIAERIPLTVGFNISITLLPFEKKYPFDFNKNRPIQILWLNIFIRKEKRHRTGKIVYRGVKKK